MLARATGQALDASAIERIHARKTELACDVIAERKPAPRAGVAQLMALAAARGWLCGFVTSTERANIDAILALGGAIAADRFDVVIGRSDVTCGKPHPEPYLLALKRLEIGPEQAIAIEDTATSVTAAVRAGITTVAKPGAFASDQGFWQADLVLPALADEQGQLDLHLLSLFGTA